MMLNCIFDTREYKSKPTKFEMGTISKNIIRQDSQNLSLEDFLMSIKQGRSYISGSLIDATLGRKQANIQNINFFSLDVDNHDLDINKKDIYTNYTRKDAVEIVKTAIGITPVAIYTTFTGTNKANSSERFRLIYLLDHEVDYMTIQSILKIIVSKTGDIFDKNCVDASRIFLGSNSNRTSSISKNPILLSSDKIKVLFAEQEEEENQKTKARVIACELKNKNTVVVYSDNAIEDLKAINLSEYLGREGYSNIKASGNGYKMPCPIHHGKNDNFHMRNYNGSWRWICFSKCDNKNGSIIDLYMELHGVDVSEAIKELCSIYGIERQTVPIIDIKSDPADCYHVKKYISNDFKTTKGILDAVKNNKKILINGVMACGKTYFVTNNLYTYCKSIGKILIIVIPGVNQLNNLEKNKKIPIVCEGEIYKGTQIVATTPESLPKVIAEVGVGNFILVVDESHERVTSLYRTGYKADNIGKAEKIAYRIVHLTATPTPLLFDTFDKTITVSSDSIITNKVNILTTEKNSDDEILAIVKGYIARGRQVILYNNNIEQNKRMAAMLEEKTTHTITTIEEGQTSFVSENRETKSIVTDYKTKSETVYSGKKVDEIISGNLKSDIILVTSSILAGIDLYTRPNAILIINTRSMFKDNVIQLIGRFRDGIEVVLVMADREHVNHYLYQNYYMARLNKCQNECNLITSSPMMLDMYKGNDGLKAKNNIEYVNGAFIVDKLKLSLDTYTSWCRGIMSNPQALINELRLQEAFAIDGDINITKYEGEVSTELADLKKIDAAEKKKIIAETESFLLGLDDATLKQVLIGDVDNLQAEVKDHAKSYFEICTSHKGKIDYIAKELFTKVEDFEEFGQIVPEEITDRVAAFRDFGNRTYSEIQREIEANQTREVNRKIKQHGGAEVYLKFNTKNAKEVFQSKIRFELRELEQKRGRLTDKVMNNLTESLIAEGYLKTKETKIYLHKDTSLDDRGKALIKIQKFIKNKVNDIYNFWENDKGNDSISSVKY